MSLKEVLKKIVPQTLIVKRNQKRTMLEIQKHKTMSLEEKKSLIAEAYKKSTGNTLHWDSPERYTEKLNVSKLLCATSEKTKLADKYLVREWVSSVIGEEYLIPVLGVYDDFDQIDFDELPDKFVIKCNHDSGSVTLCDKSVGIDKKLLKLKYDYYLKRNLADMNFEMHYENIKPRIIIEKYMGANIKDYKFICMGGHSYYCRVDCDRFINHKRTIYDMDWKRQSFSIGDYPSSDIAINRPDQFDLMKEIVLKLCKGIDQVRVDLYEIDGKVYFGEMTFTSDNGMDKIYPDEYDFKLGELWNLKF